MELTGLFSLCFFETAVLGDFSPRGEALGFVGLPFESLFDTADLESLFADLAPEVPLVACPFLDDANTEGLLGVGLFGVFLPSGSLSSFNMSFVVGEDDVLEALAFFSA